MLEAPLSFMRGLSVAAWFRQHAAALCQAGTAVVLSPFGLFDFCKGLSSGSCCTAECVAHLAELHACCRVSNPQLPICACY